MNNIELQSQLLKYKGVLNDISHISYSFKELNRNQPYVISDNDTASHLLTAYRQLISDALLIVKNFEEYEKHGQNR